MARLPVGFIDSISFSLSDHYFIASSGGLLGKLYDHFLCVETPLTTGKYVCRYANTLLVSLNNRISIREAALSGRGTLPISQSTTDSSRALPGTIVHVEIENFRHPFKGATVSRSSEDEGLEEVIGV